MGLWRSLSHQAPRQGRVLMEPQEKRSKGQHEGLYEKVYQSSALHSPFDDR